MATLIIAIVVLWLFCVVVSSFEQGSSFGIIVMMMVVLAVMAYLGGSHT